MTQRELKDEMPRVDIRTLQIKPALCLDLDGTVRYSKTGEFIKVPEDIVLFPGVEAKLWEYRRKDFILLGISNQGSVAYGMKTINDINAEVERTISLFDNCPFDIIKACFNHEKGKVFPFNYRSLYRKPDIGMLALCEFEAFNAGIVIDWQNSLFVGDRPEDEECAKRAGIEFQWAWEFFNRPESDKK